MLARLATPQENESTVWALLVFVLFGGLGFAATSPSCEAPSATREILNHLAIPFDARQPAAERTARTIEVLRKALGSTPRDIFLHEAYQDTLIGRVGDERDKVIEEYRALLAKNPGDPVFLYLAARAEFGWKTPQAIARLKQVMTVAPQFAPAHLLLARIDSFEAFENPKEVAVHLDRFSELCPSSVRILPELRWSKDRELIARTVTRVRKALAGRTDAEAAEAYPLLWALEQAMERSDNQTANRERVGKDVELLRGRRFTRNAKWFAAIQDAGDRLEHPEWVTEARKEMATLYPRSSAARDLAWSERNKTNPAETDLALAREWPGSLGLAYSTFWVVVTDRSSTSQQVGEAVDLLKLALKSDPEGMLTLPPVPIEAAADLAERGARLEDIQELVRLGFALTERTYTANSKSDLYANAIRSAQQTRDSWYLWGYFPLLEAHIKLGQFANAKDTLAQVEDALNRTRPSDKASSEDKFRQAELQAWQWYLKGLFADKQGRKLDALVAYRNSIATYPPRRPRADRRDEVMQAAQQLWKEMGGTAQGWSDWAAHSALANFYAGSGGPNAWAQLAIAKPGLLLTDSRGNHWRPEDLGKKTSFVTLWASWCGPCLAELPYLEKLALRFRDRADISILALNVDDDPKEMDTALKELKVTVPSIAARDFAYEMLPTMAIPAAWLLTPSKTVMFSADNDNLDKWLEVAVEAVEKAAVQ
jgi:thiol-disulfide isomerase/thioredoxin